MKTKYYEIEIITWDPIIVYKLFYYTGILETIKLQIICIRLEYLKSITEQIIYIKNSYLGQ